MIGILPTSLTIDDKQCKIRTDYRNILTIFEAFSDTELSDMEKWQVAINILYVDYPANEEEAIKQAAWFLRCGKEEEKVHHSKPVYSWSQDENMIFSAVNAVAGKEVREVPYMHYWTFMAYFQEIGDCLFTQVVNIRSKKQKRKKLDKAEAEFYANNRELIDLKRVLTPEEKQTEEFLKQFK